MHAQHPSIQIGDPKPVQKKYNIRSCDYIFANSDKKLAAFSLNSLSTTHEDEIPNAHGNTIHRCITHFIFIIAPREHLRNYHLKFAQYMQRFNKDSTQYNIISKLSNTDNSKIYTYQVNMLSSVHITTCVQSVRITSYVQTFRTDFLAH